MRCYTRDNSHLSCLLIVSNINGSPYSQAVLHFLVLHFQRPQLSQWLCHDDSTINIVVLIIIIIIIIQYKKLSCRRETAPTLRVIEYFDKSLKITRSFEMTLLSRACISPY